MLGIENLIPSTPAEASFNDEIDVAGVYISASLSQTIPATADFND
jgi:hypothetical protein